MRALWLQACTLQRNGLRHTSRNQFYAGAEVIKVELLEQRVKGTT